MRFPIFVSKLESLHLPTCRQRLSVEQAAKRLGVGKSTLYRELQAQEEMTDDL